MPFTFNFNISGKTGDEGGEVKKRKLEEDFEDTKTIWKDAREIFVSAKHFQRISNLESLEIFDISDEAPTAAHPVNNDDEDGDDCDDEEVGESGDGTRKNSNNDNEDDDSDGSLHQPGASTAASQLETVETFQFKIPKAPGCDEKSSNSKEVYTAPPIVGDRLHLVNSETVVTQLKSAHYHGDLSPALHQATDLVAGVYEGGLKIWECSEDLVRYLSSSYEDRLGSMRVLELGCGAGLPGLFAFLKGASVDLNDYNEEVLDEITIPNILLNLPARGADVAPADFALSLRSSLECHGNPTDDSSKDKAKNCDERSALNQNGLRHQSENEAETNNRREELLKARFFSGDWGSLDKLLTEKNCEYDLIMTSETIYNPENHEKLISIIRNHLAPGGVALIGAKIYYFGVGGGTRDFQKKLEKAGFRVEIAQSFADGVKREILSASLS